ncbi:MAG TPA: hypothetical protein VF407_11945 [Polyangiaceae bacterium]
MRIGALVVGLGLALATTGCLGQAGPAAAQEAARELNTNLRFGRMELVMERVSPADRDTYVAQHRSWGNSIRIADSEMDGMSLLSKEEALVMVKVAWYEPTTQELRVTTLRQTWKKEKDNWLLTAEARADGDMGLLGEPIPASAKAPEPTERRPPAQFQTVRIAD